MADRLAIRVDFTAPQLGSFFTGVSSEVDRWVSTIEKRYANLFSQGPTASGFLGGAPKMFSEQIGTMQDGTPIMQNWGSAVKTTRIELDGLNNALKVTAQAGLQLRDGRWIPVQTMQRQFGDAKEYVKALNDINTAEGKIAEASARRLFREAAATQARDDAQARVRTLQGQEAAQLAAHQASMADLVRARNWETTLSRQGGYWAQRGGQEQQQYLQNLAIAQNDVRTKTVDTQRAYQDLLATQQALHTEMANPAIVNYDRTMRSIATSARRAIVPQQRALVNAQGREIEISKAPLSTLPPDYQRLPKGVTKMLTKAGLSNVPDIMVNDQKATFDTVYRDMERGLTHFGGQFQTTMKGLKNAAGEPIPVMQRWSATVDDMGRVVQTTGRNLRGFGRIFEQIGRDFQKVLEWTVATTLIFGSIQALGQSLQIIKQLDADLTRFAVTANLSAKQTKEFYNSLFQVAQVTATPIEELVTAADDFALALKKPGQSTKELTNDIIILGEAVGIYTNLTGQDTVSATDQLVAVMKQLGYTASEVYIILNKVTASAGGQSGAIADITKGLAVMAEAGKQAGLSVDQQIGVIKTLSQVTSKSPAEVATAFKNLVGALENPAAIKALKNYNIALISEGNNIIGIYEQIARKIRTGDIAANDVSGLLRAISGGPRRAPDAAALLANINTVLKETAVSASATNEAFVANAQIMTTLQAKFTQFQNTLKDKTFQQLGQVFKDVATAGIQALTKLLEIFNVIPAQAITATVALAGLFVALKLGQRVVTSVIGAFATLGQAEQAYTQLTLASTQATNANTQALTRRQQVMATMTKVGAAAGGKAAVGSAAGGAVLGGGLAAMAGGGLPQIAGSALTGAGMGLLLFPEASGLTKLIGGLAILGGSLISLIPAEEGVTEASKEATQALLGAYQAASDSAANINAIREDQKTVLAQIRGLEADKSTLDNQANLNELYKQYADNVLAAYQAQVQLNDATKQFSDAEAEIPGAKQFGSRLQAILLGNVDDKEFQRTMREYQTQLLQSAFPEIQQYSPDIKKFKIGTSRIPQYGSGLGANRANVFYQGERDPFTGENKSFTEQFDLKSLDTEGLKSLFADNGQGQFIGLMQDTRENIDLVISAINTLAETNPQLAQSMMNYFSTYLAGKDNVADAAQGILYYKQAVEGLRFFRPDTAAQLDKLLPNMSQFLKEAVNNMDAGTFASALNDMFAAVGESLDTGNLIPNDKLRDIGENLAVGLGFTDGLVKGTQQYEIQVDQVSAALLGWKPGIDSATNAMVALSEATQAWINEVDTATERLLSGIASKSQAAYNEFLSGNLSSVDYDKEAARLSNYTQEILKVNEAFNTAANEGGDAFKNAFDAFNDSLVNIPGLQDAASMSAADLITRMFELADVYGLNQTQVDKLGEKLNNLFKALDTMAKARTMIGVGVDVDFTELLALYKALNKGTMVVNPYTGFVTYVGGGKYTQTIRDITAANNTITGFGKSVANLYSSGSGSSRSSGGGGSSRKSRQGKDYSELDLPEELSGLPNQSSLIKQAIANARALQKKIPGAAKEGKNDVVTILDGMKKLETVRGIREDILRRALEDLAAIEKKRLDQESKADVIRRIRVGAGDFAAIANVPVNSKTGVSMGGPEGPINITLNLNGTVMTPAQFDDFANKIAAAIARQLAK